MGFWKRIFGICETRPPADEGAWSFADGKVEIRLDAVPELSSQGGAVRLEGKGLPERLLVVHGNDGRFHAFRNRCTHMGRRLDPAPGSSKLRCCSVSKSEFGYGGEKLAGPAKEDLIVHPTSVHEEALTVHLK